ncbi:hypothetical protein EV132_1224 [Rhizobium sullae]|uniref:Uncharacterized protein n=1 Tax=Rhizobium sullae TaxID=50338 RepID=A0A4R3PTI4_RHISU|nr:hypothetical protein EV132_1224 [Rhizobium sullae]
MCLSRRTEFCFDAEMDFDTLSLKPTTTFRSQMRWLWNLSQPKQCLVKGASCLFLARWHCDLDVVYSDDVQISLRS